MKKIILILGACVALLPGSMHAQRFTTTPQIERKVDSLMALMTIEEKAGQLMQYSADFATGPSGSLLPSNHAELARQSKVGSFLNVHGTDVVRKIQRITVEETRLHIPLIFGLD